MNKHILTITLMAGAIAFSGCTAKVVGDPDRPITINAHITLDVKGLKDTAVDIEDYVSGEEEELEIKGGNK